MSAHRLVGPLSVLAVLMAFLALSSGVAVATGAPGEGAGANATIERVGSTHSVAERANATYVWERTDEGATIESYLVEARVDPAGAATELCLEVRGDRTCTPVDDRATARFPVPANASNDRIDLVLRNPSTDEPAATESLTLRRIERDGDLDRDGLHNEREVEVGTNLTDADTDGDGLADGAELRDGTDPLAADTDDDGLADGAERTAGTDPTVADTDGDGLADGVEVNELGTDPLATDTDGDGLADGAERKAGTDPLAADTDGDGLADGAERKAGTDPLATDTDGDGLADGAELRAGADPTATDTDGDGVPDAVEVNELGTDPTAADTDGDFLHDRLETRIGTNPTNPLTPAWFTGAFLGFVFGIGLSVAAIRSGWGIRIVDVTRVVRDRLLGLDRYVVEANRAVERAATAGGTGDDATADSAAAVVERSEGDLVADETLVTEMVEAEGGRMRQSGIVDATDWSKAKVSRLLSRMADEGDVVKVRLGRENVICLDWATPTAVERSADARARPGLEPPEPNAVR